MRKYFLLWLQFACILGLSAQSDTTILIEYVTVTATQINHFEKGRGVLNFDSTLLSTYQGQDIGELLSGETGIYIKTSSPGNLSTTSIRGTGFGHVVTLWNGFPIQSPMNGGMDLSLINVGQYDKISILKGGNSAIYGSGAIGGTVILENDPKMSEGLHGGINIFGNTTRNFGYFSKVDYAQKRWNLGVRWTPLYNQNKYKYGSDSIQKNALHDLRLFSTHFRLKLNSNSYIKFWTGVDDVERDISPSKVASYNGEHMGTKAYRFAAEWSKIRSHSQITFRLGHFRDSLNYHSNSVLSLNRTKLSIAQFLSKHYLENGLKVEWGLNEIYAVAEGNNIIRRTQNKLAFFTNFSYALKKWSSSLSMRQAVLDEDWVPFTFTWGYQYEISKYLQFKGNISKNFRAPTMNDLYWPNLGNPDLKSENGWSGEVTLNFRKGNWHFEATYFQINGLNWISWSPNNVGLWTPKNSLKVISQGLELDLGYEKTLDKWSMGISIHSTFVKSILKEEYQNQSSIDIGKQLIYVPKGRTVGQIRIRYQDFSLRYQQAYTSSVRTIQKELKGYYIGNLNLNYELSLLGENFSVSFDVKNIWNKDYEVVAFYPMPLRNFGFKLGYWF